MFLYVCACVSDGVRAFRFGIVRVASTRALVSGGEVSERCVSERRDGTGHVGYETACEITASMARFDRRRR